MLLQIEFKIVIVWNLRFSGGWQWRLLSSVMWCLVV